jgi:acid phosphatase
MHCKLFDIRISQQRFGGSWGNHQWLITTTPCPFPNAPPEIVNVLDEKGVPIGYPTERIVTPDGVAVNTVYSTNPPHPSNFNASRALPLQNGTTIGDLLTEAKVTWKWYSGGWKDANNGKPDPSFQYHHQPFNYYSKYAPGQLGRDNLQDEDDLLADLAQGTLPQVSFYKPLGRYNMHPGYSVVADESEHKLQQVMGAIMNSKYWSNCLVLITFDEHGGRWDHVPPKTIDRWGPGIRIPTVAVSPMVKKSHVESTYYDTTAIMKMIQDKYGLRAIGSRDAMQNGLENIFETTTNGNRPAVIAGAVVAGAILFIFVVTTITMLVITVIRKQREKDNIVSDNPNSRYYRVW